MHGRYPGVQLLPALAENPLAMMLPVTTAVSTAALIAFLISVSLPGPSSPTFLTSRVSAQADGSRTKNYLTSRRRESRSAQRGPLHQLGSISSSSLQSAMYSWRPASMQAKRAARDGGRPSRGLP